MTSHELAHQLLAGPDKPVELTIANPKDSAYTRAEIAVTDQPDFVQVYGWVASDDEEAFAPWADYDESGESGEEDDE